MASVARPSRRSSRVPILFGLEALRGGTRLELRLLGRTVLHAALVGLACGLFGSLFFVGVNVAQDVFLERLTGYVPLRAYGDHIGEAGAHTTPFRPWLLWLVPAIGATLGGLLTTFVAPEAEGGGADATIAAFHRAGGVVRWRVPWVKTLASVLCLGFGGSGGREGPTLQIGGAIGSVVGRQLRVSAAERRILLVAGMAAGIAAVFRTPLGAALLAVELLYKDDFESDALIPAVLASVVSYSVFISIFGESTLFAHDRYPFVPAHLPLYALLAVVVSAVASVFVESLGFVQRMSKRLPVPRWLKPGIGGAVLGIMATVILVAIGSRFEARNQGFGILGGGYGAAQVAITGASWMPQGWRAVEVLALLGVVKIIATSLTVGSGGSAGDFGPSLVIGGLFGGAFGHAARLLLHDGRIQPGAFAMVGMGVFYGGIAKTPISSLVLVCELAGSYDLLVPLMLAEGIAFVALRKRSLYHAQPQTRRDSPAHRRDLVLDVFDGTLVRDVMARHPDYASFDRRTSGTAIVRAVADTTWQDVFPVLDDGRMIGVIDGDIALRTLASDRDVQSLTIAADLMQPPVAVREHDRLQDAIQVMLDRGVREVPVTNDDGAILGFLDEADVTRAYLDAASAATRTPGPS